jgi:hypothetical protein
MSEEDDADCAFSMRKGVKKVEQNSLLKKRTKYSRYAFGSTFSKSGKVEKIEIKIHFNPGYIKIKCHPF